MMLGDAKANMKPDALSTAVRSNSENLGLNGPLIVQYIRWIGNMLTGNFGYSTQYKKDVIDMIGTPMLNTVMLNLVSMLVTFLIAVPLGIATAVPQERRLRQDHPGGHHYWLQPAQLHHCPAGHFRLCGEDPDFSPSAACAQLDLKATPCKRPWIPCGTCPLPVIVMSISGIGSITRYVRAAMIDVLRMDYIKTARAKGLREKSGYLCPRFPQRPDPRGDHCHRLGGIPVWRLHRH